MRTFRRKVAASQLNDSASALRRQWAQGKAGAVAQVGHLDFGNRARRLLVAEPRVRRAANEKGCRTLMASRLRRNRASSGSPGARLPWAVPLAKHVARDNQARALINPVGRRELEGPLQVSAPQTSRRVERKSPKREHLHQDHNNFGAIFYRGSGEKFRSRFF